MILNCLPKSLSEYKIMSEFGVSHYVAHTAKFIHKLMKVLSFPDRKYQQNLPDDVIEIVKNVFLEDDIR